MKDTIAVTGELSSWACGKCRILGKLHLLWKSSDGPLATARELLKSPHDPTFWPSLAQMPVNCTYLPLHPPCSRITQCTAFRSCGMFCYCRCAALRNRGWAGRLEPQAIMAGGPTAFHAGPAGSPAWGAIRGALDRPRAGPSSTWAGTFCGC